MSLAKRSGPADGLGPTEDFFDPIEAFAVTVVSDSAAVNGGAFLFAGDVRAHLALV